MVEQVDKSRVVSISEIAKHMNSMSLQDEVVVSQTDFDVQSQKLFPLYVDALMIILVRKGGGKLGIDLTEYQIQENSLIVLQPKNYIFLSECKEETNAVMIVCSRRVIEDVIPKLSDVLPLLVHHRTAPVTVLSDNDANTLLCYFNLISKRLESSQDKFLKQEVIRLLQAALYSMMSMRSESESNSEHVRTRKDEIMAKFILEVTDGFRRERHVNYYADRLCITPKHLSAVVKQISGRTAGEWIDNFVIMEAKVLLKTTDKTIQEISDLLNFRNQSFFGKFFKHLTGHTPTAYRKENS
ncbi:MAG: helix-turn-helix domain-containing protein [Muribaculum sp.]|nr:helix-turn-helix domain-containing protein [Muribaculum sp.]